MADKPPFQTWEQISGKIELYQLTAEQQADLWECLFLTTQEIGELLSDVKHHALQPCIYALRFNEALSDTQFQVDANRISLILPQSATKPISRDALRKQEQECLETLTRTPKIASHLNAPLVPNSNAHNTANA